MKRNPVWKRRSIACIAAALLAAACDPRQAVGPGSREKAPPAAVAGQVYSSTTGRALAGALVEIVGIGTGFTDPDGMYRIGSPAAVKGMAVLALRVEAPGHAPVTRLVHREGDVIQIPRVHLTPLHQGTRIGPNGGEYTLSNGVRIQALDGAVGGTVTVGVTMLAAGASGRVDATSAAGLAGTFHVSPLGTDFKRPLRLLIPLQEAAKPLSKVSLYTFNIAARRWVLRGTGTVDENGLHANVEVDEAETYAYTTEKNWASRQTAEPVLRIGFLETIDTGCIPAGEPYTIPAFTYNTQFSTTADPVKFPGLVAYLYGEYGGDRTVPATVFGPYGTVMRLYITGWWIKEEREGEAWLLAEPENKYPYKWHHTRWGDWLLESEEECEEDPQGIIA